METLTYGFQKPSPNDPGSIVFPAMEQNIERLDNHNHNGLNSRKLEAASIAATTETIASASWVADSDGLFSQVVTLPAGYNYGTCSMKFRLPDGSDIFPEIEREADNQYKIIFADNSTNVIALYATS